jgi:hypothetical protein
LGGGREVRATPLVPGHAIADSAVSRGTRFLVQLDDTLEAKKVRRGKEFDARTLEDLQASDGRIIRAGARLKGEVTYAENDKVMLRFSQIDTKRGTVPLIASVVRIVDEENVRDKPGDEGEVEASGNRGRNSAIGAVLGGGLGAAIGAAKGGGKGAAIGAGTGAAAGALIGVATGGKDLILYEGTRLELQLDRPLVLPGKR